MVNHLDRDFAGCGPVEWTADGGVKHGPCRFVDLGAKGALQLFVGIACAGEIGVADEEALAVVIGVDEPAGDVVG